MSRVKDAFDFEVPVRTVFESPTVAQMADRINGARRSPADGGAAAVTKTPVLVPFHPRPGAPAMFCVHPLGGQIHWYKHLARLLRSNYDCYGVRSRALADPLLEHQSVDEMAGEYAETICRHDPRGGYCLVGYSAGGLVAVATAHAIEASGRPVSLVALLDTYLLDEDPFVTEPDSMRSLILGLREALEEEYRGFPDVWQRLFDQATSEVFSQSIEERVDQIQNLLAGLTLAPANLRDLLTQQMTLFDRHVSLLTGYRPPRIRAPLYVCDAEQALPGVTSVAPRSAVDWSWCTSSMVHVERTAGNHFSMMRPPIVRELSGRLTERIASTWSRVSAR